MENFGNVLVVVVVVVVAGPEVRHPLEEAAGVRDGGRFQSRASGETVRTVCLMLVLFR